MHGQPTTSSISRTTVGRLIDSSLGSSLCVCLATVTLVWVVVVLASQQATRVIKATLDEDLAAAALLLAAQIDADEHATLRAPEDEALPAYAKIAESLRTALRPELPFVFAYTMRSTPEGVRFVVDGTPPGDADGDGVEDHSALGELYTAVDPAMLVTLTTGRPTVSPEPIVDKWGAFVSGFAPLVTSDGRIDGLVGVDYQANHYMARLGVIRRAAAGAGMVGSLLAASLSVIVWSVLRRREDVIAERQQLARIAELTSNAVIVTDVHGRVVWTNEGFTRISGYTLDEVRGQVPGHVLQCDKSDPSAIETMRNAIATGRSCRVEIVNRSKSGRDYALELEIQPVRDKRGVLTGFISIETDVTERKRVQASLVESEARFRTLADAVPIMMWLAGTDQQCTDFNRCWLDFTGRTIEDALGEGWIECVHPDDRSAFRSTYNEAFSARRPFTTTCRLRRDDGEYRWIEIQGVPRQDPHGSFEGYAGGCMDMTEAVDARERIARQEALLRETGAVAGVGGWELDVVTMTPSWSEQTRHIHEVDDDEQLTLERAVSFYAPDARPLIVEAVRRCIETGEPWDLELPFITRAGRHLWVRAVGRAERVEGRTVRLYGAFQDVTARHAAQEALRVANEDARRLASAIDAHADAVFLTDASGRITRVNRSFERMSGYTDAEAVGQTPRILKSGRTDPPVYAELWSTIAKGKPWSGRMCNRRNASRADSQTKATSELPRQGDETADLYWVDASITPLCADDGSIEGFVAMHRDVTDLVRSEAQEALRLEGIEAKLRVAEALSATGPLPSRIAKAIDAIVGMADLDQHRRGGVLTSSDDRARPRLFAHSGNFDDAFLADGELEALERILGTAAMRAGSVVVVGDCPVSIDAATNAGSVAATDSCAAHGHYVVPLMDRSAEEPSCLGVLCLYTERDPVASHARLAALREIGELMTTAILQERAAAMVEAARMQAEAASAAKSEFLANMSHEIRTPMTAILGYADLLAEDGDRSGASPQRLEYIATIKRNGEHLLLIINDILDLSKIEAGKMTVERLAVDPRQVLLEVESLMSVKAAEKGISLAVELVGALPARIHSDPVRLRQILVNLVGNAIKFTDRGGVILRAAIDDGADGEPILRLEVADTGIGMSDEQMRRLFHAFEQADMSTTRKFGGTGLGLRISKSLARMLGGDVTVTSAPGRGSTFTATIATGSLAGVKMNPPGSLRDVTIEAKRPLVPSVEERPLIGVRIFLAEDGPDNQRLIAFHLRKAGAEIRVFDNGRLALEAMTADGTIDGLPLEPSPCDVLLTDMQMPEMDGYTLARTLRAKGWRRPIVALTAHAMSGDAEKCITSGCDAYTSKPIDRARLIEVCRAAARRCGGAAAQQAALTGPGAVQIPSSL